MKLPLKAASCLRTTLWIQFVAAARARPLGAFVVAAAATAEGRRGGRGCARGGGGGCEDDYPGGEREAARGQFRGLFH